MNFWKPDNLRRITGGRWLVGPNPEMPEPRGVSIDTRTLKAGQVFVAIKGDNFDGHDFLPQAADAGAPLLIVSAGEIPAGLATRRCAVLQVDDTLTAMTRLATAYRRTFTGRVIAVTGSVGKTTTKHLIHALLGSHYVGSASPKSFNNHIGVPLTILNANPGDQYLVAEIGTNAPGEIASLARIAQPDVAVITTVGPVHLERLGSIEGVLREKAALLSHLTNDGLAIVNGDIAGLPDYRKAVPHMVTFGRGDACDLRLTDVDVEADGSRFKVNGRWSFRLPLLGEHNVCNALAAIAVARYLKLTETQIAEAMSGATPPAMRLARQTVGSGKHSITVINDCYNASPMSTAAAVGVLERFPAAGRRVAILGDMLELGDRGPEFHRELGERVAETNLDLAMFVGRLSLFAADSVLRKWDATRVLAVPSLTDATCDEIVRQLRPGDTVLIKASRGVQLERLLPAIENHLAAACEAGATSAPSLSSHSSKVSSRS